MVDLYWSTVWREPKDHFLLSLYHLWLAQTWVSRLWSCSEQLHSFPVLYTANTGNYSKQVYDHVMSGSLQLPKYKGMRWLICESKLAAIDAKRVSRRSRVNHDVANENTGTSAAACPHCDGSMCGSESASDPSENSSTRPVVFERRQPRQSERTEPSVHERYLRKPEGR